MIIKSVLAAAWIIVNVLVTIGVPALVVKLMVFEREDTPALAGDETEMVCAPCAAA